MGCTSPTTRIDQLSVYATADYNFDKKWYGLNRLGSIVHWRLLPRRTPRRTYLPTSFSLSAERGLAQGRPLRLVDSCWVRRRRMPREDKRTCYYYYSYSKPLPCWTTNADSDEFHLEARKDDSTTQLASKPLQARINIMAGYPNFLGKPYTLTGTRWSPLSRTIAAYNKRHDDIVRLLYLLTTPRLSIARLSTIGLGVSIGATLWYILYSHFHMVELHHLPIRSLALIW
jgi:hypothetical protein